MATTARQRVVLGGTAALLVTGVGVAVAAAESGGPPKLPDRVTEASKPDDDAGEERGRKAETSMSHVPRQPTGTGLSAAELAAAGKKVRVDPEVVTEAVASVDTSLDALFAPLPQGEELDLPEVVGKYMAEEISNTQLERQDLGWTIEGAAKLDGLAVVKVDDPTKPAALTLRTCVDTSDVVVRNSAGRDMTSGTVTRSRSLFDLALVEGDWKVLSRTFAKNPDC
ncbi:hypothetical protein [Nocardioides albus]|uniref:Secreted protein n=1 Tax=Nocardioides albus TaxID=1841 RepID=A0A7W5A867_9ACTN|nr:hypothetical protein [Nocardioides albus]MBB3091483.1 hypothetical protein [Nocardioides albus]GGU41496.1 hypothetical protein GCM10007979_45940 [Nocardioides albus]